MLNANVQKHTFHFNTPGGTSRGVLHTKDSWFIKIWDTNQPDIVGIGECSILPKLSIDDKPEIDDKLKEVAQNINEYVKNYQTSLSDWPAVRFAIEMALLDLQNGGRKQLFLSSNFYTSEQPILINGLIWMGDIPTMKERLAQKIEGGFKCIKIKVGSINFDDEVKFIQEIRKEYSHNEIELRLDANGAFKPEEALEKLKVLSEFNIHSIEQPIKAGQWEEMKRICAESPIAIALDEELIGVNTLEKKRELLTEINPQYLILKPSLLGGFKASDEWIDLAAEKSINWWATSALEGNIGLNAIAQWVSTKNNNLPQGLGTGQVFSNNIESPLQVINGFLVYSKSKNWGELPV